MTNKYLSYDEQRAPKVRAMFSRLAWRYDLVNDVMSFGLHRLWKRQTVEIALAGLDRAPRARPLLRQRRPVLPRRGDAERGSVVGADFTLPMLAVARRRARSGEGRAPGRADGRRGPQFVQARRASRSRSRTARSTSMTISYGLRNVADLPRAVSEMRRVLAPGGRCVVLDFGKPDGDASAGFLYRAFLRTMMPAVGWLFHGDPETYLYIPESLERFPAQRGVEKLMREAGFDRVRYEDRLLGTMGINVGEVEVDKQQV